jgi:DNA invertase Pin-like site-specific DNA recombinase
MTNVEFEAVDFRQAHRLTIHILAAVAEHEAEAVSNRTKAAMTAAKARGARLGGFRAGRIARVVRPRPAGKVRERRGPLGRRRRPRNRHHRRAAGAHIAIEKDF